jgi:hypothetical protein
MTVSNLCDDDSSWVFNSDTNKTLHLNQPFFGTLLCKPVANKINYNVNSIAGGIVY